MDFKTAATYNRAVADFLDQLAQLPTGSVPPVSGDSTPPVPPVSVPPVANWYPSAAGAVSGTLPATPVKWYADFYFSKEPMTWAQRNFNWLQRNFGSSFAFAYLGASTAHLTNNLQADLPLDEANIVINTIKGAGVYSPPGFVVLRPIALGAGSNSRAILQNMLAGWKIQLPWADSLQVSTI